MRESKRLHILHASMQWSDNDRQTREDFDRVLSRGADVVTFTEVSERNRNVDILRKAAQPLGYQPIWESGELGFKGGESALAVAADVDVFEKGAELVNLPESGKPPAQGHSARLITWAQLGWQGNVISVFTAHWVTGFGKRDSRTDKHERMSQRMVELVEQSARGARLAFFSGDVNLDEERDRGENPRKTHAIFTAAGLTTIWDELGIYPSTHGSERGGTIDVIGSYDPDRRVSASAATVWRDRHSDHRPISAFYNVADRKPR